jgi:hypothetical protein
MKGQRYKPTFLLRCVMILAIIVALALVLPSIAISGTLLLIVLVVFVAPELVGLIIDGVANLLAKRVGRDRDTKPSSVWFVDSDKASKEERERFNRDTENNPTLR